MVDAPPRRLGGREPARCALPFTRAWVRTLAAIVAVQACAGAWGALGRWSAAFALLAGASAGLAALRRSAGAEERADAGAPSPEVAPVMLGCGLLFVLGERLVAAATRHELPYDALSYHLALPLSWLASGHLGIVPLPFGDGAPAFAPANPSLLAATFLALTGKVQAAQLSQWPFLVLALVALVELARARHAPPTAAAALGGLLLSLPELYLQSTCAMGDVAVVGCALACLALHAFSASCTATESPARAAGEALDGWLALGLLAGTKSVGLVVAFAFAGMLFVRGVFAARRRREERTRPETRWRGLPALCGAPLAFVAAGGFWCVRTALRTGNPVFPVAWTFGGRPLFAGFYTPSDMRAWEYHVPVSDLAALGAILREQGLGFLLFVLGWFALRPRRRWHLLLSLVVGALFLWCVVPYQEPRFFLVVWAGALLVAAHGWERDDGKALGCLLVALAVAWLYPVVPARWLAVVAGVASGGLAVAFGGRLARDRSSALAAVARPAAVVLASVAPLVATAGLEAPPVVLSQAGDAADPDLESTELARAWRWMDVHGGGVPVFIAGTNLVGPWAGARAQRSLHVVNLAGQLDVPLDHYPSPADVGRARLPAEPFPDRAAADRETWTDTLGKEAPAWLVVARLAPVVADVQPHDADGFPAERVWADDTPARFRLQYANAMARVYAVVEPSGEARSPRNPREGLAR